MSSLPANVSLQILDTKMTLQDAIFFPQDTLKKSFEITLSQLCAVFRLTGGILFGREFGLSYYFK